MSPDSLMAACGIVGNRPWRFVELAWARQNGCAHELMLLDRSTIQTSSNMCLPCGRMPKPRRKPKFRPFCCTLLSSCGGHDACYRPELSRKLNSRPTGMLACVCNDDIKIW